jgi:hypothetical protein
MMPQHSCASLSNAISHSKVRAQADEKPNEQQRRILLGLSTSCRARPALSLPTQLLYY